MLGKKGMNAIMEAFSATMSECGNARIFTLPLANQAVSEVCQRIACFFHDFAFRNKMSENAVAAVPPFTNPHSILFCINAFIPALCFEWGKGIPGKSIRTQKPALTAFHLQF